MSVLYIWEFSAVRRNTQIPKAPGMVQQTVAVSANSALSAPFTSATSFILLTADVLCFVGIGSGSGGNVLVSDDEAFVLTTDVGDRALAADFGTINSSVVANFMLAPGRVYKLGVNAGDQVVVSNRSAA